MEESKSSSSLLGNRYQLQQTLGTGGMARVYLAKDLMLERPVAIKILKQDFSKNPTLRRRFRQEAQAVANLSHPNIVTVHDFGFHKGRLYIVMEHVPGQNLKDMIRQYGIFSVEDAIDLLIQACSGIGYAHRAGLVHCDVKPHNILVTPDQRVKVTDFGIARALSSINPEEQYDIIWGSPQYFSPEQAGGKAPSPASDVYSLGVILYEMLTGKLPFEADDATELARLHREAKPVPPIQYNSEIPQALDLIIQKVLSKEPTARYRTTDQLGRILLTIKEQMSKTFQEPVQRKEPVFYEKQQPIQQPVVQRPIEQNNYPPRPTRVVPEDEYGPKSSEYSGVDWLTIGLGLFAVLTVGGLIPFWIYIYFTLNASRTIP
ncbi:MAG: protein kinase [Anaerolineaceae bacterium]|nr:protein kinase [Anaerolineaceae bacterium]